MACSHCMPLGDRATVGNTSHSTRCSSSSRVQYIAGSPGRQRTQRCRVPSRGPSSEWPRAFSGTASLSCSRITARRGHLAAVPIRALSTVRRRGHPWLNENGSCSLSPAAVRSLPERSVTEILHPVSRVLNPTLHNHSPSPPARGIPHLSISEFEWLDTPAFE